MLLFEFSLFTWFCRKYMKTFSLGLCAFSSGSTAISTFYSKSLTCSSRHPQPGQGPHYLGRLGLEGDLLG